MDAVERRGLPLVSVPHLSSPVVEPLLLLLHSLLKMTGRHLHLYPRGEEI
jgi:hypothetical protein